MVAIPYSRPRCGIEGAIIQLEMVPIPKRVFPVESGTGNSQIPAMFEGRLPIAESRVSDLRIGNAEKGAFPGESLPFNQVLFIHATHESPFADE